MPGADFDGFFTGLKRDYPNLDVDLLERLARAYGTKVRQLLTNADTVADLGRMFGAGFTEAEACYLVEAEFARSADDILWRRSKLGLHMSAAERAAFSDWMTDHIKTHA